MSAMSEQPDITSAAARLAPIIAFKHFFIHFPFLNVTEVTFRDKNDVYPFVSLFLKTVSNVFKFMFFAEFVKFRLFY